jgi:hypothetical protein
VVDVFAAVLDFFAGLVVFFAGLLAFFVPEDDVELFFAAVVAVDFLAAVLVFFAPEDDVELFFAAVVEDFFAAPDVPADFLAADAFVVAFLAGLDVELAFVAVDFAAVDFLAVPPPGAALPAAAAAVFTALSATARVSAGSCLAPETTALRSAPGLNFGTAVFLAWIRSPVRGLRTVRASRTRFSKEPNPVIATFSPRATSRVMVSMTASSAWAAALRFPA